MLLACSQEQVICFSKTANAAMSMLLPNCRQLRHKLSPEPKAKKAKRNKSSWFVAENVFQNIEVTSSQGNLTSF
jgi:hypothetical protein